MLQSRIAALFACLVSLMICFNVQAAQEEVTTTTTTPNAAGGTTTVVERHVITTEAPQPKIVVPAPVNFVNCFSVNAGWFNNIWIDKHQVCQYSNSSEGVAWVQGYWQCSKYKSDEGVCTSWDWKDAHWVKTYQVY